MARMSKSYACGRLFQRLDRITIARKKPAGFDEVEIYCSVEWDLFEKTSEILGYTLGDYPHISSRVLYDKAPIREMVAEEDYPEGGTAVGVTPTTYFDPDGINELIVQNGGELPQYFLLSIPDWCPEGGTGLFIANTEGYPYCRYLIHISK